MGFGEFLFGSPEQNYQQSTLNRGQQKIHKNYLKALEQQGAGGAFGDIADYYRDLLSNDSETYRMLEAPEMRRFNEEIIPGLSEQFAGMGAGGLSSSGFRNAAVNAGTDLSERLGAIRAQLRQQGAQGFQSLAQGGLNPVMENINRPATEGFLTSAAPAIAEGGLALATGGASLPFTRAASTAMQSFKGKTSPYGGGFNASQQMPSFRTSMR